MKIRRGFSFVELLFAVMILGIGFIMIAGVFPVAISQQQTNAEETSAAVVARSAITFLEALPESDKLMPVNPQFTTFLGGSNGPALWAALSTSVIVQGDPRYAWVGVWRRTTDTYDKPLPFAQVIIMPVRVRGRAVYTTKDDIVTNATFIPKRVRMDLANFAGEQTATITGAGKKFATPGSYILLTNTANAGKLYRLGPATAVTDQYLLSPGNDMEKAAEQGNRQGYLIGADAGPAGGNPSGPTQEINVYSTFIRLNSVPTP